jgi:hypothetical protein
MANPTRRRNLLMNTAFQLAERAVPRGNFPCCAWLRAWFVVAATIAAVLRGVARTRLARGKKSARARKVGIRGSSPNPWNLVQNIFPCRDEADIVMASPTAHSARHTVTTRKRTFATWRRPLRKTYRPMARLSSPEAVVIALGISPPMGRLYHSAP